MPARKKKPAGRRAAKPVSKVIRKAVGASSSRGASPAASRAARTARAKKVSHPSPAHPSRLAHPSPLRAEQDGYVPNESEKYMSKRQLRFFQRRIEGMREDIGQGVERTMASMQEEAGAIPDDNDRASKESEFAVELRQRDRDRRLLGKISRALEGIEDGGFGYCEECGDPIGVARLLARPVASLCIECKDLQERLEKNRTL